MFIRFNPNPFELNTGDCTVRALSKVLNQSWDDTYWEICTVGFELGTMPSKNSVWGECLMRNGFKRFSLPNTCPMCYTVRQFCEDHPYGIYVLATGSHVVAVVDGDYYDNWDSGMEIPVYAFRKGK